MIFKIQSLLFVLIFLLSSNIVTATIPINRVNCTTIGLYEKFEAIYDLSGFSYNNPYDPEQIDVTAVFTSPTGKAWCIFGFYDNYLNRNEWKIRFSPNEIGKWTFVITAKDANKTDQSEIQSFSAIESAHHGWLQISEKNPHYLEHNDGTSWFGVGMYTPWRNDVAKFDKLKQFGGNTFAIWNITYGGMVNGYGLIEEELGRYNQEKCGRIDSLLFVAEQRDLKCMYCFWPHDLFSNTVWAHQWHQNPYRTICDVKDVYSDETCWEYQKKQYRYLIARFSHSRALGIWEMMNEINGTDGWAAGKHDEAKAWVHKVDSYFKANDPFLHPTTASRSGGYTEYWPEMYELIDLPNMHVYETQGWPQVYSGNTLRSSMYNYAEASQRLWTRFEKPSIFGEAGADWVHVDLYSPDYTAMYHNAIWASLTNGMATTPYWWTFTNPITDDEREQMLYLSKFVADINFVGQSKNHFEAINNTYDLYGMHGDSTAFGWIRQVKALDIAGNQFDLENILNPLIPVYAIRYFNTWTGENLTMHIRPYVNGLFRDKIPEIARGIPDVAFKIKPAQGGDKPARLELSADVYQLLNIDTLSTEIACYFFDEADRFCPNASATITFTLDGPGSFDGSNQVVAQNGAAQITFRPSDAPGMSKIIATAPGLIADTISMKIKDRTILDDFESYTSNGELRSSWVNILATKADVFLERSTTGGGDFSMRLVYGVGGEYKSTAVIEKTIDQNYVGAKYLCFWFKPDGSNRDIEIKLYNSKRRYWRTNFALAGTDTFTKAILLDDFKAGKETDILDLSDLATLRITIRRGGGTEGTGLLLFDDFKFPAVAPTTVKSFCNETFPADFKLEQNYPNPFNLATRISYFLPHRTKVTITVYNLKGQKVDTLVDETLDPGKHTTIWQASQALASGLYYYKFKTSDFEAIKKCLLIK